MSHLRALVWGTAEQRGQLWSEKAGAALAPCPRTSAAAGAGAGRLQGMERDGVIAGLKPLATPRREVVGPAACSAGGHATHSPPMADALLHEAPARLAAKTPRRSSLPLPS